MNPTSNSNHLFQFELVPVENIEPWRDNDGNLSLSLYALTDGHFNISAGNEVLLQYTPEILSRWDAPAFGEQSEYAEYQVACFADDVLASVSAAVSPIPAFFENIVRDEALFLRLWQASATRSHGQVPSEVIDQLEIGKKNTGFKQDRYDAFRWLGERRPWLNYLTASPEIWFVRIGNEVWIQWNNVERKFEGIDVWTARRGTYAISVQEFLAECHGFSERLLAAMESRIASIEKGSACAKTPLDAASLRKQLLVWKNEFEQYLSAPYQPDVGWEESERAMRNIAFESGISLPGG